MTCYSYNKLSKWCMKNTIIDMSWLNNTQSGKKYLLVLTQVYREVNLTRIRWGLSTFPNVVTLSVNTKWLWLFKIRLLIFFDSRYLFMRDYKTVDCLFNIYHSQRIYSLYNLPIFQCTFDFELFSLFCFKYHDNA